MKYYFISLLLVIFSSVSEHKIGCNNGSKNSSLSQNTDSLDSNTNAEIRKKTIKETVLTPEMFGAIGDGKIHKLSTRFSSIQEAQKEFPGVKDLDITIDGAAFQKAVNTASKEKGTVLAEKNYAINFPIVVQNYVTIDGKGTGIISNDNSRQKNLHHVAFLVGNHSAAAFSTENENGYKLYDVNSVSAGQNFVELKNVSDAGSFKQDQLVMVVSSFKRHQKDKKTALPYHVTMSKIIKIENNKIYFEYPIDESLSEAQLAANGGYDKFAEINYGGVENVTIQNLIINSVQITMASYGYKCHFNNIHVNNGIRLIGVNAMAHSSFNNISGNFSWRCIEVKTGSSDVSLKNIQATYKPAPGYPKPVDGISIGEYSRNVTIDSFKIDFNSAGTKLPIINLHSRKAIISNGTILCKNQNNAFFKFYNDKFVSDPKYGCYKNLIKNVNFYGSNSMKNIMEIGDDENKTKTPANKNNWVNTKKQNKTSNKNDEEDESMSENIDSDISTPPSGNTVENCTFDGGSYSSVANLLSGSQNVIQNCTFLKGKLNVSPTFSRQNTISNNKVMEK